MSDPFPALEQHIIDQMTARGSYYGKYIPDALPVSNSRVTAGMLIYSAVIVEYAIVGYDNASHSATIQHAYNMASSCYEKMLRLQGRRSPVPGQDSYQLC